MWEYRIKYMYDSYCVQERPVSDNDYFYWSNCLVDGQGPYFYNYEDAAEHILRAKKLRGHSAG